MKVVGRRFRSFDGLFAMLFECKVTEEGPNPTPTFTVAEDVFNTLKKGDTVTFKGHYSVFTDKNVVVRSAYLIKKS